MRPRFHHAPTPCFLPLQSPGGKRVVGKQPSPPLSPFQPSETTELSIFSAICWKWLESIETRITQPPMTKGTAANAPSRPPTPGQRSVVADERDSKCKMWFSIGLAVVGPAFLVSSNGALDGLSPGGPLPSALQTRFLVWWVMRYCWLA